MRIIIINAYSFIGISLAHHLLPNHKLYLYDESNDSNNRDLLYSKSDLIDTANLINYSDESYSNLDPDIIAKFEADYIIIVGVMNYSDSVLSPTYAITQMINIINSIPIRSKLIYLSRSLDNYVMDFLDKYILQIAKSHESEVQILKIPEVISNYAEFIIDMDSSFFRMISSTEDDPYTTISNPRHIISIKDLFSIIDLVLSNYLPSTKLYCHFTEYLDSDLISILSKRYTIHSTSGSSEFESSGDPFTKYYTYNLRDDIYKILDNWRYLNESDIVNSIISG